MISAFDKTFKLGILLSIIDWVTFNVVFLLFSLFFQVDVDGEFMIDILIANIAYLIALQMLTSVCITDRHSRQGVQQYVAYVGYIYCAVCGNIGNSRIKRAGACLFWGINDTCIYCDKRGATFVEDLY